MRSLVVVFSLALVTSAHADTEIPAPREDPATPDTAWHAGPRGRTRVLHLALATGFGAGYVVSEAVIKPSLAPDRCRWCDAPGFDRRVRDALVWEDFDQARSLSNLSGYVALPIFGVGVIGAMSLVADDRGWGRVIDDVVPIIETVTISQVLTQSAKFAFGRARPFVRYRDIADPIDQDNNLSFFSGHSALTFGITVSAGMIAHWRRSRLEPVIWGVGLTLSATTAYLRIAADKHYFSDVVTGSAVGIAAGLIIPRWTRYHGNVALVPIGNGVALTGAF